MPHQSRKPSEFMNAVYNKLYELHDGITLVSEAAVEPARLQRIGERDTYVKSISSSVIGGKPNGFGRVPTYHFGIASHSHFPKIETPDDMINMTPGKVLYGFVNKFGGEPYEGHISVISQDLIMVHSAKTNMDQIPKLEGLSLEEAVEAISQVDVFDLSRVQK